MFDINILNRIILELNDATTFLPKYHTTEISTAESEVEHVNEIIADFLNKHKKAVRLQISKLNKASQQKNKLEYDKHASLLRMITKTPDVGIRIILSNIHELQRGLRIYKYLRIKKLICLAIKELLAFSSTYQRNNASITIDNNASITPFEFSQTLLNNCTNDETDILTTLSDVFNDNNYQELFYSIPPTPIQDILNCQSSAPNWLLRLFENDKFTKQQNNDLRTFLKVEYGYVPINTDQYNKFVVDNVAAGNTTAAAPSSAAAGEISSNITTTETLADELLMKLKLQPHDNTAILIKQLFVAAAGQPSQIVNLQSQDRTELFNELIRQMHHSQEQ